MISHGGNSSWMVSIVFSGASSALSPGKPVSSLGKFSIQPSSLTCSKKTSTEVCATAVLSKNVNLHWLDWASNQEGEEGIEKEN